MIRYTRGELGLKVLYALSVGVLIPVALVVPNAPTILAPALRALAKRFDAKPQALRRSLLSLKRKRLVSIQEKGEETVAVISVDGKKHLARGNLEKLSIKRPKKWDGKWRIIIFDVPEKQKAAREALRETLRNLGFQQIQKSCFLHPFECRNEIDITSALFNTTRYITYIVAESVEGEKALRAHFKL